MTSIGPFVNIDEPGAKLPNCSEMAAVSEPETLTDKFLTVWSVDEYSYRMQTDAGEGDRWTLLRFAFEQVLDLLPYSFSLAESEYEQRRVQEQANPLAVHFVRCRHLETHVLDTFVSAAESLIANAIAPQKSIGMTSQDALPKAEADVQVKRMDKDIADLIARRLDKDDPRFKHGDVGMWAKRIRDYQIQTTGLLWSCSTTTVHATGFWSEVMKESGRGRQNRSVKTVAYSAKTAATFSGADSVLNELAAREEQPAIDAVMQSRMTDDAKAATVEKIRAGEMTPAQAIELAKTFPKRRKRDKELIRE
ncbi:MAG: hypothetical protein ACKV2Q_00465 [Planctomycetaceae bacterium]